MRFELHQRGICVASVEGGDDQEPALRSGIMHYALMYSQDGPCVVKGPLPDEMFDEDDE